MPILTNSKHELFAQAVARGASASAAYITAGYPAHGSNAARLRKNELVSLRVEELLRVGAERAGVTVERIVNGLAEIAFGRPDELLPTARATDRISAMEKLGKHLGMFKDADSATPISITINGRDARYL